MVFFVKHIPNITHLIALNFIERDCRYDHQLIVGELTRRVDDIEKEQQEQNKSIEGLKDSGKISVGWWLFIAVLLVISIIAVGAVIKYCRLKQKRK